MIKKITPVLVVDSIEPLLNFWQDQLGYEIMAKVPHGEHLGFVILKSPTNEVMLQTRASVIDDLSGFAEKFPDTTVILYAEVTDLDLMAKSLSGAEIIVPRRTTPYGAQEIWIREPSGNLMGFAQFGGG